MSDVLLKHTYGKNDFKTGDMILYPYVEDEVLRGRILRCLEDKAEIEICFHGKKNEEMHTDTLMVYYSEIVPMSKGIKSFKTKAQKKAEKLAKKNNPEE